VGFAPVAQSDRATAFERVAGVTRGACGGKRNPHSGGHCIGRPLTRHGDGDTEETAGCGYSALGVCVGG